MTKRLPIIVSVPHAGLRVPDRVKTRTKLSKQQLIEDGDEGAAEIYSFEQDVTHFIRTDIARAYVDLNRAPQDYSRDGVVKTHTCQMVPVYASPLETRTIREMLRHHYYPWHGRLRKVSRDKGVLFGIDCHTMAETAPEISPDYGKKRPWVCLSNGGKTCPDSWLALLGNAFEQHFGAGTVGINTPFKGGYIIREHSRALNWIQLELSREAFAGNSKKKAVVLSALSQLVDRLH